MNFLITGDTHGDFSRFNELDHDIYPPEDTVIIVLGDAGVNFFLNERDVRLKKTIHSMGYQFYLVRGNHEMRPEDMKGLRFVWSDLVVHGPVLQEREYENIHYLLDGETYYFLDSTVLVVGGGYSVDKFYRIAKNGYSPCDVERMDPDSAMKLTFWNPREQLDREEQLDIIADVRDRHYNLVLTHTCPISIEPTDLFLDIIDQNSVDKSTEQFLEELKNMITFDHWMFGHYHADRIINDKFSMFFQGIYNLKDLIC